MSVVIDLSSYKDRVGSRVTPGEYLVVVDDTEQDTSRAGNPMINVWLRVIGGDHDGATITDRLTITEKALFRVVGFLNAIGIPTPRKRIQVQPQKWIGRRLVVTVDDGEPYNGRVKSEVRDYSKAKKSDQVAEVSDLEDVPEDLEESEPEVSKKSVPAEGELDIDELDLG